MEELDGTSDVVMELSDLVNYVEPVKFKSFDESLEKDRNCEMSSFSEVRGLVLLKHEGAKFHPLQQLPHQPNLPRRLPHLLL